MIQRLALFCAGILTLVCLTIGYTRSSNAQKSSEAKATKVGAVKTHFAHAVTRGPYPTLYDHVEGTDVIVVGTAGPITREGSAPWNLSETDTQVPSFAATVQSFRVARILKGSISVNTLSVFQKGGVINGEAYLIEGCPRLVAGRRYVLFLNKPGAASKKAGFVVYRVGSKVFNLGGLDLYSISTPTQSALLIENGVAKVPYDEFQSAKEQPYVPKISPQLLGKPEEYVIREILTTVEDTKYPHWPQRRRFD